MVVADTHALVWWASTPDRLSGAARDVLNEHPIALPVISCMEIAALARRKRITLAMPVDQWLDAILALPNVTLMQLTREIAVLAANLPDDIVRDPTDRLITATAIYHGVSLVTADRKIIAANLVPTIW